MIEVGKINCCQVSSTLGMESYYFICLHKRRDNFITSLDLDLRLNLAA